MNRSTLTERARRVARSAIRRVRSENRLVSRYIFNAKPVRDHRRQPPALGPEAVRVAAELERSGVALTTVDDLIGDDDLFQAISDETLSLRARPDLEVDPAKPFLTELLGSSPALSPDDPLLALALDPEVRGIAETYCGMTLQVQDVNIWVNRPVGEGPTQSQRWHRDLPEDYDIVKCFIYLSDVPDGAGPLQYVSGSNTVEGRKVRLPAEFDGIGNRLADEDVAATFGPDRIVTARADIGTLVFADTRGIHRGGLALDRERVVGQITYASRACTRPRNLRPAPGVDPRELQDFRLVS
jgi:hypothetical protein